MHINGISTYLPDQRSIHSMASDLGLRNFEVKTFNRFHGLNNIAMNPSHVTFKDFLQMSLEKLIEENNINRKKIKHLIYCHTIMPTNPYSISLVDELRKINRLNDCRSYSLTMAHCCTGALSLQLLDRILQSGEEAIVLIGDRCFYPAIQLIRGSSVCGEAAVAIWVTSSGGRNAVKSVDRKTLGQFSLIPHLKNHSFKDFQENYTRYISDFITEVIRKRGLNIGDVDYIVPHNVNLSSWKNVAGRLDFPLQKIYLDHVSEYGHCFGADNFINLKSIVDNKKINIGSNLLLISAGLGATLSAIWVEH